jgi:hypothetical protein
MFWLHEGNAMRLLTFLISSYCNWRARRYQNALRKAAERHARVSQMAGLEYSDEGGRLNKLRFLKREHAMLDWSSWHAAIRDD